LSLNAARLVRVHALWQGGGGLSEAWRSGLTWPSKPGQSGPDTCARAVAAAAGVLVLAGTGVPGLTTRPGTIQKY